MEHSNFRIGEETVSDQVQREKRNLKAAAVFLTFAVLGVVALESFGSTGPNVSTTQMMSDQMSEPGHDPAHKKAVDSAAQYAEQYADKYAERATFNLLQKHSSYAGSHLEQVVENYTARYLESHAEMYAEKYAEKYGEKRAEKYLEMYAKRHNESVGAAEQDLEHKAHSYAKEYVHKYDADHSYLYSSFGWKSFEEPRKYLLRKELEAKGIKYGERAEKYVEAHEGEAKKVCGEVSRKIC